MHDYPPIKTTIHKNQSCNALVQCNAGMAEARGQIPRFWQIRRRRRAAAARRITTCPPSLRKLLTERLWQYHPKWKQPKWKFSTFYGLPGTTSYPYLPLRMIDPPDTRSHPQGGVQIYPQPNHLSKKGKKKYIPPK